MNKALHWLESALFKIRLYNYNQYRIADARARVVSHGPSFGQHFEDKVLEIILGEVTTFIDIGANDGLTLSNTFYFAERGAAGLCFEPGRDSFSLLKRVHAKNPDVICINEAISKTDQKVVLHEGGYAGLLSTLHPSEKLKTAETSRFVNARPLNYWLQGYKQFSSVDLLSIDVEGAEMSVLESIDFRSFRAKIIIVEIDNPESIEVEAIYSILDANNYRMFARNSFNGFFAHTDFEVSEARLAKIQQLSDSFKVFNY
jgi:FkbM family methyltransferase